MKKFVLGFLILIATTCPLFGQSTIGFHRVAVALSRAQSGLNAQIVPNATVTVTQTSTGTAATIYSDPLLTSIISPSVVVADNSGNYSYYIALNYCVTETITSPGQGTRTIPNICSNGGGGVSVASILPIEVNGGQGPVGAGTATISCANGCTNIEMQYTAPVAGQYVVLNANSGASGDTSCPEHPGFTVSSVSSLSPFSGSILRQNSNFLACGLTTGQIAWTGATLPAGISASNVTAIYMGYIYSMACTNNLCGTPSGTVNGNGVSPISELFQVGLGTYTYEVCSSSCGSFNYATANWTLENTSGGTWTTPPWGSIMTATPLMFVYYTGTPITSPTLINVAPPLLYSQNVLSLPLPDNAGQDVESSITANEYIANIPGYGPVSTTSSSLLGLTPGANICFVPETANSSTTPTFSVSTLATGFTIALSNGDALVNGDIAEGQTACLTLSPNNGGQSYWMLLNPQISNGGRTSVDVNGSSVTSPNFNATTPAAGGSFINITWQSSGSDVSAEVPYGSSSTFGVLKCGSGTTCTSGVISASGGGGGSATVLFASTISGTTPGVDVSAGNSAMGTTDSAAALNAAIAAGNVDLEVDSGFALSTSLILASNTTIHCTAPQNGFIMQASANAPVLVNKNQNAPTTSSGTGGYLVSNQTDNNIRVLGCMLNANSVEAVTGAGNGNSTPNTTNPDTGVIVTGVLFTGVAGITFNNNEIYDAGTYAVAGGNDSNVIWDNNYVHVPQPTIQLKNTNGLYLIGPDNDIEWNGNLLNTGDDALALAAEDCNRPGVSYCLITGWKWGPIQHAHLEHNIMLNAEYGIRLLDATELIDDIDIGDTQGTICGHTLILSQFASLDTYGSGNLGRINVHDWKAPTTGSCTGGGDRNFELGLDAQDIQISNVQLSNPAVNWPVLTMLGSEGTVQTLSEYNWDITTTSSTYSFVNVIDGPVTYMKAINDTWHDTQGTGYFFSGTPGPTNFTCSGYVGRGAGTSALQWAGSTTETGDCYIGTSPPYFTTGTAKYMAWDGYPVTAPPTSPSWINSVKPSSVATSANGTLVLSDSGSTSVFWQTETATTSVEAEEIFVTTAASNNFGVWLYDSTNSVIWTLIANYNAGELQSCIEEYTYSGSGSPVFSTDTCKTGYGGGWGTWAHFKMSVAGGTLSAQISLDGGVTFVTPYTESVGTISAGGVNMYDADTGAQMIVGSENVQ